jgi:hypothetical protein
MATVTFRLPDGCYMPNSWDGGVEHVSFPGVRAAIEGAKHQRCGKGGSNIVTCSPEVARRIRWYMETCPAMDSFGCDPELVKSDRPSLKAAIRNINRALVEAGEKIDGELEKEYRSFKPEVFTEGAWYPNALRFATKEESDAYGRDLLSRWFVPTDSRSVPCDDPVTHVWVERRGLRPIEQPEGSERMPARSVDL